MVDDGAEAVMPLAWWGTQLFLHALAWSHLVEQCIYDLHTAYFVTSRPSLLLHI